MKKIFLVFSLLFLLASCSGNNETSSETEAPAEPLTVGLMPDFDSTPILVAKQLGYFENVELMLYNSPLDRDSALFSGGLDGTVSDLLQVCMANDKDFPVRITSRTCSLYGVIASEASGVTELSGLAGRTAGLSLATVVEYVLDMSLESAGVDPAGVEKSSVPKIPARLELISRGQIDSIAVPEPYVTAAEESGGVVLATAAEHGLKPGVIMFTQEAVDGKSQQIEDFYAALNKAAEYINSHEPDEFFPAVIEEMGLPESASLVPMPVYGGEGLPSEKDIQQAEDWLLSREMISSDLNYEDLIYSVAGNQ